MDDLIYLQAKKTEVDILRILREYGLKFEISCDWELKRYVITLIKEINDRKYKINYSYPYFMYDMLQDPIKYDQFKHIILVMIQRLNERIEKWPDEDTETIYEYDGVECSREKPAL